MWDRLNQTDIAQAKRQLDFRRAEALRKHAEEMQVLAADQAAIETLDDLLSAFVDKFKNSPASTGSKVAPTTAPALPIAISPAAMLAPATAVKSPISVKPAATVKPNEHRAPTRHGADKPAARARHSDRRSHRTNFETLMHAMTKNERGW